MTKASFTPEEIEEVCWAYYHLEHPSFAARLSNVIGTPMEQALKLLPKHWHKKVNQAAELSIRQVMNIAVKTLNPAPISISPDIFHQLAAAATGATGGFLGPAALIVELPIITVLMLRSIGDIARSQGEDLNTLEARLACVEVFGLGGRSDEDDAADTGYYGLRATLALHFTGIVEYAGETSLSIPAGVNLIRGIAARFSIAISDEIALQLVPVVGAVSGSLLNLVFMQHFQDVARGHFTLRRLERKYGEERVREVYEKMGQEEHQITRRFSPLEGW